MTVKLLVDWTDPNTGIAYLATNKLTTAAATEAGLVASKLADTNLAGSTDYVAPAVQTQYRPLYGVENPLTGGNVFYGPDGAMSLTQPRTALSPYRLASFGDSRANVNSTTPDVSGHTSTLAITKGPTWTAMMRGDTELVANYGVSGDAASGWSSAARTGGKTVQSLAAYGVDILHVQYGVNDILSGDGTTPTATTIVSNLQALVLEAVKSGIAVVFESVLPCTATGWVSAGSGTAAQKRAIADSVNLQMEAWLASVPWTVFADTSARVVASDGYADASLYDAAGIHLTNVGAAISGEVCAAASLRLLPKKSARYYPSGLSTGPNFVDPINPPVTAITAAVAGTFDLDSQTVGVDLNGTYVEFVLTPTSLSSGEATFWAAIGGDVGGYGATAKYAIAANDVLQGQGRLVIDDGNGNPAAGLRNFVFRHRCYYQAGGGVYADMGSYSIPSTMGNLNRTIDLMVTTPRVAVTVASAGIEPPTHVKGYALHLYIQVSTLDQFRVRIYSPSLRKAA